MKIIYVLAVVLIFASCENDQSVSKARFNKKATAADPNATDANTTFASEQMATAEDVSAVGTDISGKETEASPSLSTSNNNNGVEGGQEAVDEVDGTQITETNDSDAETVSVDNGQEAVPTNPNQTLDGFPLDAYGIEQVAKMASPSFGMNDKTDFVFFPPSLELQLAVYFAYTVHDKAINESLFGEITIPMLVPPTCYSSVTYGKYGEGNLAHDNYDYRRDARKKAVDCLDANGFKLIDHYGQMVLAKGHLSLGPDIRLALIVVSESETLTNGSKLFRCRLDQNNPGSSTVAFLTTDPDCHAKRITDSSAKKCLTFGDDCGDKDKSIKGYDEADAGSILSYLTYDFEQALTRSGSKPSGYDSTKKICIMSRFSKIDQFTIAPLWAGGGAFSTQAECKKILSGTMSRVTSCQKSTKGGDIFAYWGFEQIGKVSGSSTTCELQ